MSPSSTENHWHILGAGAIGCLWAAYLTKAGVPITLIVRKPSAQQRLTLHDEQNNPVFVADIQPTSSDSLQPSISQLMLCCKAQDAAEALDSVSSQLSTSSKILLIQNGMGSQQQLHEQYPELDIYCVTTTEGAYLNAPFQVTHAGKGQSWIGKLESSSTELSELLAHRLAASGLSVQPDPDINQRLWLKLAINGSINGLTALYECRNGKLITDTSIKERMDSLSTETSTLLAQLNIQPPEPLQQMVTNVIKRTALNFSSTLQDIHHGRSTELAYINGYLLKQAAAVGVLMPNHQQLMEDLQQRGIV